MLRLVIILPVLEIEIVLPLWEFASLLRSYPLSFSALLQADINAVGDEKTEGYYESCDDDSLSRRHLKDLLLVVRSWVVVDGKERFKSTIAVRVLQGRMAGPR